ncbi:MAG: V-type ATP synthase subunit D [Elusimicrobiota bacterium]
MGNVLNINPNRMELMKLSKRHSLAMRGHRLLKDKQDELMDMFTEATVYARKLRQGIEERYEGLKMPYYLTRTASDSRAFITNTVYPPVKAAIRGAKSRLMNLIIPEFEVEFTDNTDYMGSYLHPPVMPGFIRTYMELVKDIIELANAEKKMYMIAEELQKVRRRVNALEYIFIPKLEETIEYVSMQLEEMERENITRLMKIKEIVRSRR